MKVLVSCEFSEIVKKEFLDRGHDAHSCDLLPGELRLRNHHQEDVIPLLDEKWDLMIAHPPCTRLAVSGARWFTQYKKEQKEAIEFFMRFINADIPRIAVENPISIMSTVYRKPDQIIQPWQFGHGETKAICLWLKNLPKLEPTNIVEGREARVHRMPPSPDRWKKRSRFYKGIGEAMAVQWGNEVTSIPPKPKGSGILEEVL